MPAKHRESHQVLSRLSRFALFVTFRVLRDPNSPLNPGLYNLTLTWNGHSGVYAHS